VINSAGNTVFAVYSQGVRIYVADDPAVKAAGSRSGFAVGGFSMTKGLTNEYLRVTPDSVRVYIEKDAVKASGSRGGFAVGGFSSSTGSLWHLSKVSSDSLYMTVQQIGATVPFLTTAERNNITQPQKTTNTNTKNEKRLVR
ncbi:MAG: hypothetical protein HY738_04850, partial [Bacteroidia bacterium]|nr:hypothetical protein [Bacteroidia bacterium]